MEMKVEVATIVSGSETPVGDGTTGALRCVLVLLDRSRRSAVLKRGPIGQVAAEAFSALLLRGWGLSVPEPFLVNDAGTLAFASADTGYPNLKHHLGLDALPAGPVRDAAIRTACNLVCGFPSTPLAAACDEAIDNRDRNLGNILWDGKTESWIDHAFALGEGSHMLDRNKLCDMAHQAGHEDRISRGAVAQALLLDRSMPTAVEGVVSVSPIGPSSFATAVSARITTLAARLLARFPSPADLLSGLPNP